MRLRRRAKAAERRGSALVFALVTVTLVAGLSYSLLKITHFVGQRQAAASDDKRAFYLAEAGLAEAYFGLGRGYSGTLGAPDAPVSIGDGLVWVEATEIGDDLVNLRSTGLCGSGRSTVEITVEAIVIDLGIFAEEGIDLAVPFLVDGYDSATSSYEEQALPSVVPNPGDYVHDNVSVSVVRIAEMYYDYVRREGDRFYFVDSVPRDPIVRTIDARVYFDSKDTTASMTGNVAGTLGPTTGGGGALSSNGDIVLSSSAGGVEVHGDVMHGPDSELVLSGVSVDGTTGALPEGVELDPVELPDVEMLPGFVHDSAIPRVIPPGDIGHEFATVSPDSELLIMGPGTAVFGDLDLEAGSRMTIENTDGPVEIFVDDRARFAAGSEVSSASEMPIDLMLQVVGGPEPVELLATSEFYGGVYAPGSHVSIGSDFELFGFLISNTLALEPGTRLHFDSGIAGTSLVPRLVGWKIEEIPAHVRQNRGDPYKIFYGDGQEPDNVEEAMQSDCWTITVTEWGDREKIELKREFEGPAVAFEKGNPEIMWSEVSQIEPPTIGTKIWHTYVEYHPTPSVDSLTEYVGPFEDLSPFTGHIHQFSVWEE